MPPSSPDRAKQRREERPDRDHRESRAKSDRHRHSHSKDKEGRHGDRRDRHRQRDRSRSQERKRRSKSPSERRVHNSDQKVKEEIKYKVEKVEVKREPGFGGINVRKASELLAEAAPKEAPNFEVSGKLLEDTNVFNGVVVKYSEPEEARKPRQRWRFYVFKGQETLPVLHLHRQSAYLIGKDRKVCDLPVDHPSCSRQHAVLQYRFVPREREDGSKTNKILPYVIDLGSSNGTYLNGDRIESRRYIELKEKDVLKFGYSSREYVLLHEDSRVPNGSDVESE